jgi:Predicted integral membrane protein
MSYDTIGNRPEHVSGSDGQPNVAMPERIASGLAGVALTTYAVAKRRDVGGAAMALAGGYLLFRGVTGRCAGYTLLQTGTSDATDSENAVIPHNQGIKIEKVVTVNRPASELFAFWHDFENLPRFMPHLESVQVLDNKRSHWVAKAPLGKTVEWDAEIINEVPGEMIAWKSVEGADIPNAGSVWFKALPADRGTEVRVVLEYDPPAGRLGAAVAKLLGEEPGVQVRDALRHFKNLMEAGEVPTIDGQPHGTKGRSPSDAPQKRASGEDMGVATPVPVHTAAPEVVQPVL